MISFTRMLSFAGSMDSSSITSERTTVTILICSPMILLKRRTRKRVCFLSSSDVDVDVDVGCLGDSGSGGGGMDGRGSSGAESTFSVATSLGVNSEKIVVCSVFLRFCPGGSFANDDDESDDKEA